MSFPKQSEIELPLLKTLHELGEKAEPKELYPELATIFPQLTEEGLVWGLFGAATLTSPSRQAAETNRLAACAPQSPSALHPAR
jgi:hypothetical protein